MKKDNVVTELKTALDVALLKHNVMNSVASDKGKTMFAFAIIILASVITGLKLKFLGGALSPSWGFVLSTALYQVVSAVISIYLLSLVAKSIFKGQATHNGFFRVMGFGMIVTWLAIIPYLSIVGGFWWLVIVFVTLKVVHKLTTGGAIGALIVTIIAMVFVSMVLTATLGAFGIRGMSYGNIEIKGGDFGGFGTDGFKMNIDSEDGAGSVEMKDGKVIIEGSDGKKTEISIPNIPGAN
ncbi:YIP1 family protein [Patescibacteria group bacterium]|nr:YIP1 family protein [Patescibacteria group bacterium]MBU1016206.1 YIP1 family protein [Patescibacteria group bacterium]MBU1684677.1 YIP1 family protein [Patescibacteria group bacterium]MBU1938928.1 YIP1 family protein [Patescibacteria group bacterium]